MIEQLQSTSFSNKSYDNNRNVNGVKWGWRVFYLEPKPKYYIILETETKMETNGYKFDKSPSGNGYPFGTLKTKF